MKQVRETGKQIVSKGTYVRLQGKRAGIGLAGILLFVSAAVILSFGMSSAIERLNQYSRTRLYLAHDYKGLSEFDYAEKVEANPFTSEPAIDYTQQADTAGSMKYSILYAKRAVERDVETVSQPRWWIENVLGLLLFTLATYLLVRQAFASMKRVENITPGVPLTRANIADLPAPESLVRASQESVLQEAVLLRVAAQGQGAPPEQLLRAGNGQE